MAVVKAEVVMVKTKEAVVKADVGRNRKLEIGDDGIEDWWDCCTQTPIHD